MFGNNFTINKTVKLAAQALSHTSNTCFALLDFAVMVTKMTAHFVVGHRFIKHGFPHKQPSIIGRRRFYLGRRDSECFSCNQYDCRTSDKRV
jgi:hypothetical protein